jgi:hypothetical protein
MYDKEDDAFSESVNNSVTNASSACARLSTVRPGRLADFQTSGKFWGNVEVLLLVRAAVHLPLNVSGGDHHLHKTLGIDLSVCLLAQVLILNSQC